MSSLLTGCSTAEDCRFLRTSELAAMAEEQGQDVKNLKGQGLEKLSSKKSSCSRPKTSLRTT